MDLHFRSADPTSLNPCGLSSIDDLHDNLTEKIKDSYNIKETNVDDNSELLDHLGDYTE